VALSVAGSDSSGGAGLQADLKTFVACGVYGASAVTCVTAQDTSGVREIRLLDPAVVLAQLDAVLDDLPVAAVKTGMIGSAELVELIAARLARNALPLVVDPVLVATSGDALASPGTVESMIRFLLPRTTLLTPNLFEAAALSGQPVTTLGEMREAALALVDLGARAVLVKGGHLTGPAVDILLEPGGFHELAAERIPLPATHGTGCVLSAAITAALACGQPLVDAVAGAKHFLGTLLEEAPQLGRGARSLHPRPRPKAT
jgi:hydroxymethylpyrimidine/phosphomethylpyrimidine kinase